MQTCCCEWGVLRHNYALTYSAGCTSADSVPVLTVVNFSLARRRSISSILAFCASSASVNGFSSTTATSAPSPPPPAAASGSLLPSADAAAGLLSPPSEKRVVYEETGGLGRCFSRHSGDVDLLPRARLAACCVKAHRAGAEGGGWIHPRPCHHADQRRGGVTENSSSSIRSLAMTPTHTTRHVSQRHTKVNAQPIIKRWPHEPMSASKSMMGQRLSCFALLLYNRKISNVEHSSHRTRAGRNVNMSLGGTDVRHLVRKLPRVRLLVVPSP